MGDIVCAIRNFKGEFLGGIKLVFCAWFFFVCWGVTDLVRCCGQPDQGIVEVCCLLLLLVTIPEDCYYQLMNYRQGVSPVEVLLAAALVSPPVPSAHSMIVWWIQVYHLFVPYHGRNCWYHRGSCSQICWCPHVWSWV